MGAIYDYDNDVAMGFSIVVLLLLAIFSVILQSKMDTIVFWNFSF